MPFPCKPMLCGLPAALSVMVTAPLRVPRSVGVKVTLIVQLELAATVAPQLLVWAKSPDAIIVVRVSGASPTFDRVTVCMLLVVPTSWLANIKDGTDRLTTGAMPVPDRLIVVGLAESLLVTVNCPVRAPRAVGLKEMLMVQPWPAAIPLLVWQSSVAE